MNDYLDSRGTPSIQAQLNRISTDVERERKNPGDEENLCELAGLLGFQGSGKEHARNHLAIYVGLAA